MGRLSYDLPPYPLQSTHALDAQGVANNCKQCQGKMVRVHVTTPQNSAYDFSFFIYIAGRLFSALSSKSNFTNSYFSVKKVNDGNVEYSRL